MRSVSHSSNVLTTSDRVAILFRGLGAALSWLPVNLVAIPYTLSRSGEPADSAVAQLNEIVPGLYLGTDQAAQSKAMLSQHGITAVLSILDYTVNVPSDQVEKHKVISIEDYPDVDIGPATQEAIVFVTKQQAKNRNVLVHCQMGMSRSASVMVGLVQEILQLTPEEAIEHVKSKRPVIDINYGFRKQLVRQG
jgi:protein-tyrosine phosphatase